MLGHHSARNKILRVYELVPLLAWGSVRGAKKTGLRWVKKTYIFFENLTYVRSIICLHPLPAFAAIHLYHQNENKMKLSDFNSQSIAQRWETLMSWGYFMVKLDRDNATTVLYAVNGFFAELTIRKSDNKVLTINGSSLEDVPLDYFQQIDHCNPFIASAKPNAELMSELVLAA
jgi:hypothetical protein